MTGRQLRSRIMAIDPSPFAWLTASDAMRLKIIARSRSDNRCNGSRVLSSVNPFLSSIFPSSRAPQTWRIEDNMATAPKDRVPNVFRIRLKQALCRRTWPQTDLSRKQLCHAIGVRGGTIELWMRSEEHTPGIQSLMRITDAVVCMHKKKQHNK